MKNRYSDLLFFLKRYDLLRVEKDKELENLECVIVMHKHDNSGRFKGSPGWKTLTMTITPEYYSIVLFAWDFRKEKPVSIQVQTFEQIEAVLMMNFQPFFLNTQTLITDGSEHEDEDEQ